MNKIITNDTSNVIEVSFNPTNTPASVDEYESHLASLIDLNEDPLEELLSEFEQQEKSSEKTVSFDHYRVSFGQDLYSMSTTLLEQVRAIKEKNAKTTYYLSEMNFED